LSDEKHFSPQRRKDRKGGLFNPCWIEEGKEIPGPLEFYFAAGPKAFRESASPDSLKNILLRELCVSSESRWGVTSGR
jgi:hypothetical protein